MAALSAKLRSVRIDDARRGLMFWCPGCNSAHRVVTEGAGSWAWDGNAINPTLSPSVLVHGGERGSDSVCHSFVRRGVIEFLGDCTHELRGQHVPLPDWPTDQPS